MTKIPSLEELRREYADVMECQAVTNVSSWIEPNAGEEFSAQALLDRALENGNDLNAKLDEALRFDKPK